MVHIEACPLFCSKGGCHVKMPLLGRGILKLGVETKHYNDSQELMVDLEEFATFASYVQEAV